MTDKKEIVYKGEAIKVTKKEGHWDLRFPDGSDEELYHHINAEENAVWMWASGKIDDASLSIGRLIEALG